MENILKILEAENETEAIEKINTLKDKTKYVFCLFQDGRAFMDSEITIGQILLLGSTIDQLKSEIAPVRLFKK